MNSRAIDLMNSMNKVLGDGVVSMGSDAKYQVEYQSTGLLPFDMLFGGGLPRGRFVQLTGDFSTLKTYVGLNAIREVQRSGGVAALIDTEHSFSEEWAKQIGIDTKQLIVQQPETGELAMDTAEVLIRNEIDLIVFDSIAATLPQAEQSKRFHKESVQPARLAALMSAALRKLTAANSRTSILWINQLREQVGITFGPTERAPGGRALPYYASIIANVKKVGKVTEDIKYFTGDKFASTKKQVGQSYRVTIEKSKLDRPFKEMYFDWTLKEARIDLPKFIFSQAVEAGLITNRNTSWVFPDGTKVVGKPRALGLLSENEELRTSLENDIRQANELPMLTPAKTGNRRGVPVIDRKKEGESKPLSSSKKVRGRTLAAGRGESSTTGRHKKLY